MGFLGEYDDPPTALVLGDNGRTDAATVSGTRAGLIALADAAGESGLGELGVAVHAALGVDVPPAPTFLKGRTFSWGERTYLMGVLNVTPDSFSDGGRFGSVDEAVRHAEALIAAGADLLDVGGESTRPGAEPVPEAVERERVLPVIERLAGRIPISVDTRKSGVARAALAAGAAMVNDVSALQHDPGLAAVVAQAGAGLCLMHMQGTPATMQDDPRYDDVVAEVLQALGTALDAAVAAGVPGRRCGSTRDWLREDARAQPLPPPPPPRAAACSTRRWWWAPAASGSSGCWPVDARRRSAFGAPWPPTWSPPSSGGGRGAGARRGGGPAGPGSGRCHRPGP